MKNIIGFAAVLVFCLSLFLLASKKYEKPAQNAPPTIVRHDDLVQKYNDKIIINIELENTNTNNNILSKLNKLEENLFNSNINMNVINKNILKNKGLSSIIKQSKLGNIIRTHLLKNTEIFILKKNGEKIEIDHSNLTNSECDIKLDLKGVWLNDNNYGLYITIKSIKINKFN